MAEAEVLYNIKSTRARGNTDVATPSTDEPTYCNINYSETQRPGSKQPAASNRRSGVTSERVALLVLSVLLAAAVIALGVTLYENTQTKKSLHNFQEECEAKLLSEILSGTEPSIVEQPTTPPLVRNETCPSCEDGWEPHGGKLYFFSSVTSTWNESRTRCKSMRGDLVVINSEEEQRFLQSRLKVKICKPEEEFWIGLTDSEKEGEWLWVDDRRLDQSLTFWREGEPNNLKGTNSEGENCVMMWAVDGAMELKTWFDQSCKSSLKSICEKPEKECV
ncbi:C-type lectin domain family 6 member A isoform X1 [Pleuronectes platessa]|uniref:C-type lectin domain family 6 member A isoform X1 n=1 Tax=Pleuronectes platessa TaxID=8262 RepID=UPI00232A48B0|nr:C-type lectin domain family 6 member A isoform X1 [Pleuronectes platessa]